MASFKSICVASQKGGVGKTTATMLLADGLAHAGHNVLVVDTDPQGSAHKWESKSVEGFPAFPVRVDRVCGLNAEDFGRWLQKRVDGLDYLLIDTPPNLESKELSAALYIADLVVMPFLAHTSSSDALEEFEPLISKVERSRGAPIDLRILVNMFNSRRKLEVAIVNELAHFTSRPVFETKLKDLVAYSDAYNYRTSLYNLPDSKTARTQIDQLIVEVM